MKLTTVWRGRPISELTLEEARQALDDAAAQIAHANAMAENDRVMLRTFQQACGTTMDAVDGASGRRRGWEVIAWYSVRLVEAQAEARDLCAVLAVVRDEHHEDHEEVARLRAVVNAVRAWRHRHGTPCPPYSITEQAEADLCDALVAYDTAQQEVGK